MPPQADLLPEPFADGGVLYFPPPTARLAVELRGALERAGFVATEPSPGVLAVPVGPGLLLGLADALSAALRPPELRAAWSLILPAGLTPTLADLAGLCPLATVVARARGRWLVEIIRGDRLVIHFQPIVRADDPGVAFAHECLVRGVGPDGGLMPPGLLFDAARAADMIPPLDLAAKVLAIRAAAAHRLEGQVFINFNPMAAADPSADLRTLLDMAALAGIDPARIVFEVVESDEAPPDLAAILGSYREAGFLVALDDLGAGFGSLNLLTTLRPDFVKLDMQLVRGVDRDTYKADILGKLLEMARKLGVGTVAEGIETEAECAWLQRHGVDYLQGYLIARPACPPPPTRRIAPTSGGPAPCRPRPEPTTCSPLAEARPSR